MWFFFIFMKNIFPTNFAILFLCSHILLVLRVVSISHADWYFIRKISSIEQYLFINWLSSYTSPHSNYSVFKVPMDDWIMSILFVNKYKWKISRSTVGLFGVQSLNLSLTYWKWILSYTVSQMYTSILIVCVKWLFQLHEIWLIANISVHEST